MCLECAQAVKVCNVKTKEVGVASCLQGGCWRKRLKLAAQHHLNPLHLSRRRWAQRIYETRVFNRLRVVIF